MVSGHGTLADAAFLVAVVCALIAALVQLAAHRVPASMVAGLVSLAIAAVAFGLFVL